MEMQQSLPKGLDFFRLPLEKGTVILSLETLNRYSEFRRPKKPFLHIKQRKISFQSEILTIGIILNEEKEEMVYLRVKPTELLVGCSVDTSEKYLSRYAYYTLLDLMNYDGECDFKEFYWPDFFHPKTGKSKYLHIFNDRWGMNVVLKEQYSYFYKPEERLFSPFKDTLDPNRSKQLPLIHTSISPNSLVIGYCLANTTFVSYRSNHYPFLIPYVAKLNLKKDAIIGYRHYIMDAEPSTEPEYTPVQLSLHQLALKMMVLAPTENIRYRDTEAEKQAIRNENMERRDQLFYLWQEAFPLLDSQPYTHYFMTYGMKNIEEKPLKMSLIPCVFAKEVPKICFLWLDKGEHYELKMRFRVGNKTFVPEAENPVFFLRSTAEPMKLYLTGTLADYQLCRFFESRNFSISVLKTHYTPHFQDFKTQLENLYEFRKTTPRELSN